MFSIIINWLDKIFGYTPPSPKQMVERPRLVINGRVYGVRREVRK